MPFHRFVEIGRVALVNYGADTGKLCTILDVIDQNRVLIDGPFPVTGVKRQQIPIRWLALTDFKVHIGRATRNKALVKAFNGSAITTKFAQSAFGKKLAAKTKRAAMTDFDRFKVMLAKKKRSVLINQELAKLKKAQAKK
mmetsp:Transcript_19588/g.33620  ORF Transcript_19588/g.33620 Transcript_19588/m.33620 type:complete len:140 (+) Transcript_19588:74-493(+)|eukprot:CAMPEP_0196651942 /NCGR_PEP_ID=MMETSP1086-20130531/1135_1 /TAXON_ID=77921 /ORGANISM="Cyanoptyche  gloeocystis , Strain SAG4.97" /LENGTH=139 /DNA_ID=CAMNT_0041982247 /DNA_START=74 /DNA_END=493 /DNA_ORIENTATION=-